MNSSFGIDTNRDYLYGDSQDPFDINKPQGQGSLGSEAMNKEIATRFTPENAAVTGGAGFLAGGPAGAAVSVGGSLLTNYLAQKAATERQKRQQSVQIENEYTKNMGDALTQQLAAYRGALR
jgi:hypothetical protein